MGSFVKNGKLKLEEGCFYKKPVRPTVDGSGGGTIVLARPGSGSAYLGP